ncbi:uncharacterized protein EDB91DRAFT_1252217 [Suillus paluster]|uniref:uncharacterized protein n=1 Tax=Suillus paluster TaxID=48578 RepID=UPI001B874205|nr:uncharacterized protein EDB91DRAFT_1252217 [Suillus paluster]KAG1731345.1 hypothetical protein EDB91DRAFT_1252217 [Suillus paluster]
MPFQFIKDLSNSVVPVRLRRPTKNRGTQPNPTVNCHESDGSIPAGIPSTFPLPSPTLPSDSSYSRGVSPAREASDMAQLFLPFVQAFAGTIPLAGAPMQAAIGGLLTSLQAIDRRDKNRADLVGLESRLHRLNRDLCNAPPARDPLEQSRRDSLVRVLEGTSAQLTNLHKRRRFAYTSVTQAIAGCSSEIDRYLMECLWSFQMQSQNDMHEMRDFIIRGQFSAGSTAVGTVALGCVTLVDATGHEHSISVNFCTSFQQINEMLQVLFKRDSIEAHIQRRYLDKGQYDLCIDEGTQVTRLTSLRWSTIEAGTKIVMRVIIKQQMTLPSGVSYECHFCGAVNDVRVESIMYSLQRRAGCSIDCRQCKRRFQISRVPSNVEQSAGSLDVDTDDTTGAEMRLIRNFHVEETSVRNSFELLTRR